jgi:hypothetical protein
VEASEGDDCRGGDVACVTTKGGVRSAVIAGSGFVQSIVRDFIMCSAVGLICWKETYDCV